MCFIIHDDGENTDDDKDIGRSDLKNNNKIFQLEIK